MFKKIQFSAIFLVMWLFSYHLSAQDFSDKQLKQWASEPVWITMMDDPNANYFETVAAFETFWKYHELPVEEDQILGAPREEIGKVESPCEKRKRIRKEKRMAKEEKEEAVIRHQYAFAVKKYRHWKILVEPYVQPDGKILSKEEQLLLHQQQR